MWGENDNDTPIYMAKLMEKKIKDSGLVVLKGAGHYSYLDAAGQFLNVAANFLGGN
jgi:pimeloyl-ACP methyl ester carboxylesterase